MGSRSNTSKTDVKKYKFVLVDYTDGKTVGLAFDTLEEAKKYACEAHLIFEVVSVINVSKSFEFKKEELGDWL